MNLTELFDKVVILSGAGSSQNAGCKLSRGMLLSLHEEINSLTTADKEFIDYKMPFLEIYQFIIASLNYQSIIKTIVPNQSVELNVEDFVMVLRQLIDKEFIIPYPLIGNWNDRIVKWELQNGNIFSQFKKFITVQLINNWTRFDISKAETTLQPIRDLLNNSEEFRLNIFTLNYDLIFESVFNSSTTRLLDNGFSERRIEDEMDRYWASDFNNEMNGTKINLYKLHGSIDWEYNSISEEIVIKDDIFDEREPLIIFGSYSKMLSFDPFLFILSSFRDYLEKATICIIIGYSFHDKYINNLLIQQLSKNTKEDIPKKMFIVDPGLKGINESTFASKLKHIQESKSLNDVINFSQISPDRLKIIPTTAEEFYMKYFLNDAQLLKQELELTEKGDKIF